MKFSPSIHAVFRNSNLSTIGKMEKVSEAGYAAFEFWKWWEEDLDAVAEASGRLQLEVGSVCTKFVSLADPDLRGEYLDGLKESIAAARKLKCKYLISQTGNVRTDVSRENQFQSLADGLKAAAPLLAEAGVVLVVEPLNTLVNHPGYFLETSREAFELIDQVGSGSVKVLYDVYHQQITEGNLIPNITRNMDKIAYFHIADHPGRHEPGSGEINYRNVLKAIRDTGFSGYIGLEYTPLVSGEESLRQFAGSYRDFGDWNKG